MSVRILLNIGVQSNSAVLFPTQGGGTSLTPSHRLAGEKEVSAFTHCLRNATQNMNLLLTQTRTVKELVQPWHEFFGRSGV